MSEVRATVKDVTRNLTGDHSFWSVIIISSLIFLTVVVVVVFVFTRHHHGIKGLNHSAKIVKHSDKCLPSPSAPSVKKFCSLSGVTTCSYITEWLNSDTGAMICPTSTPAHIACGNVCSAPPQLNEGLWSCTDESENILFQKCMKMIKPVKCNSTPTMPIGVGDDGSNYFLNSLGRQSQICGPLDDFVPQGGENI